ncbi:glycosyltransferase [Paenibacillus pasadenensis]|uniref:glycosyltransferase n=1 Tax=Paenibacillus pasadenensis TaxID=217090 RepID=UPI00041B4A76|nr:glycosyltransferase [Paenibacillus pasadenensis]
MRRLKILLYGDVDLNYLDGSAIWLQSTARVLAQDPNVDVDVLLKAKPINEVVLIEMKNQPRVKLIRHNDVITTQSNRLSIKDAIHAIEKLDGQNKYHCIIIRGFDLAKELSSKPYAQKVVPYITNIKYSGSVIDLEDVYALQKIYHNVTYFLVQTEQARELLVKNLNVDGQKFRLLYPMIPEEFKVVDSRPRVKTNAIIYSGKFASEWYVEEMLNIFERLKAMGLEIKLNIAGNKFQGDLAAKKNELTMKLQLTEGISWTGAVSRSAVVDLIKSSDIGFCWRDEIIDNDSSTELSTKLLEYGRLGKPTIVRRTKLHESILGKDYFMYAETEDEVVEKTVRIMNDAQLYRQESRRIQEACNKFGFEESYRRIKETLWSFNTDKIKVVFAGHDLKFIQTAIDYFENQPEYEVKIDAWMGHNKHDEAHSKHCLEWADVIFCEWGLGNAVWYSSHKKTGQKLVVRMHLQERETEYPGNFNLDRIDHIIAISPYILEEFHRVLKIPRSKFIMIYNMIDINKFKLTKFDGDSIQFNLGICGIIPARKRLDRALDVFENLWKKDKRYKLFVKSKLPHQLPWVNKREEERTYFDNVFNRINNAEWKENVIFEESGDDMDEWFRKIGYILSTSDFESFHLAPMEGMVSGSIPIVYKWPGAETIYPAEFLFSNSFEMENYIYNSSYNTTRKKIIEDNYFNMFNSRDIIEKIKFIMNN